MAVALEAARPGSSGEPGQAYGGRAR